MALICKTNMSAAKLPGDYVWCKYTATSGVFGTFSDLATKADIDVVSSLIPVASSATPNGYFKFILVGYDRKGRKKFIADRNIQHSISWDVLNTNGVSSDSGVSVKIDNKDLYSVRLMTGGTSATDTDNEWDKIIAGSTLDGLITAGDTSVWNWNGLYTLTSTSNTATSANKSMRGSTGIYTYNSTATASVSPVRAFRPVLLVASTPIGVTFTEINPTHVYTNNNEISIEASINFNPPGVENKKTSVADFTVEEMSKLSDIDSAILLDGTMRFNPTGSFPNKKLILMNQDIDLSEVTNIDSFTLTSTTAGGGKVGVIVSGDSGANWKGYGITGWIKTTIDAVPIMTSDTAPSGTIAYSAQTNNPACSAFNGIESGDMWELPSIPGWISYAFPSVTPTCGYSITPYGLNFSPKSWAVYGSNNNGSTWTLLDSQSNITWSGGKVLFYYQNTVQYSTYKIDITERNGIYCSIANIEFLSSIPQYDFIPVNSALITDVSTKYFTPTQLLSLVPAQTAALFSNKKARFGFYLEQASSTDTASIDKLEMQVDYPAPAEQRDISWRLLVNGVEKIPFNTAQNIRNITAEANSSDLANGNNAIKIEVKSPAGDTGEATVNVVKEVPYRLSAERTMLIRDGGYKQDNIIFNGIAKTQIEHVAVGSKIDSVTTVLLDKFINKIGVV